MHPDHEALVEALTAAARPRSHGLSDPEAYLGSGHPYLNVSVPDRRRIARAWIAGHKGAAPSEVFALAESLFAGRSHEEKTLAAILIALHRKAREDVGPQDVDAWLDRLEGWAEVDSLCQNVFPPEQLLADWPAWERTIRQLAKSPNINKRRAALVLVTAVARRSPDTRFRDLGFQLIEQLKPERQAIITKAISWLLRSLAERHPAEVAAYLEVKGPTLPAIAMRETRAKLTTGRKTRKRP